MNKQLLIGCLAAFSASALPVVASAETTLAGRFWYEVGAIDFNDDDGRTIVQNYGGTRIDLRGGEDLGNGVKALFRMRGGVAPGSSFAFDQEVWVGLSGGFGTVRFGRHDSAFKKANSPFRLFADTLVESRSKQIRDLRTARPALNNRDDGLHYSSPKLGGLSVNATIVPINGSTDTDFSLSAVFKHESFGLTAGYEFEDQRDAMTPETDNFTVGAYYSANNLLIGLLYQDIESSIDRRVYTLPVTYRTGRIGLRAAVQMTDFKDDVVLNGKATGDATDFAIGARYFLSKRTEIFGNIWTIDDAESAQLSVGVAHSF